jgi:hypothetical protein
MTNATAPQESKILCSNLRGMRLLPNSLSLVVKKGRLPMQHYEKCQQIIATTAATSEARSLSPLSFFVLAILALYMIDKIGVYQKTTS